MKTLFEIRDITDKISPTFCLSKWHQTSIYLQTGETHSCYHPPPHKIPLEEIENNPSALHNTVEKKQQRKELLNGEKSKSCQYCWNIEKLGKEYISDRLERNALFYSAPTINEIDSKSFDFDINPQYIEISFGNECNFKCGYCHPKSSSRYYQEIEQFGPYPTANHQNSIESLTIYKNEDKNPYVDAWWKWWPSARESLKTLRITGGEPLLHKSTWRLLEDLDKNPLPYLELNINSNLGVKTALVEKLCLKINKLLAEQKIKEFKLYTSIDNWGERAEYIRYGLDLKIWEQNLDIYLTKTNQPLTFMVTFSLLSVTNFTELLEKFLSWRKTYNVTTQKQWQRIRADVPYLKEPLQYDINILPKKDFLPYMYKSLEFVKNNVDDTDQGKFSRIEYEKFQRLIKYMEKTEYPRYKVLEGRRDFYDWFKEHDRRRNTDFIKVFPEMKEFYESCNIEMLDSMKEIKKFFENTNEEIPKSVCPIPWMHLNFEPNGKVVPCCLTSTHNYFAGDLTTQTIEEIWNSDNMKSLRVQMLKGEEPSICNKCYDREKVTGESGRYYHVKTFPEVLQKIPDVTLEDGTCTDMVLKYWDFRFSNLCNLKCRSCGPRYSSSWVPDAKKLGYTDQEKVWSIDSVDDKTNYDFLKDQVRYVKKIYFAGGEPLLMPEHWQIMDMLVKNERFDVELSYNTNCSVLTYGGKNILDYWKHWEFKKLEVWPSIDEIGERAELIRSGTVWRKIEENLKELSKHTNIIVRPGITVGAWNVFRLPEIIEHLKSIGVITEFHEYRNYFINLLEHPTHYHVHILPDVFRKKIVKKLENFVNSHDEKYQENIRSIFTHIIYELNKPFSKQDALSFIDITEKLDSVRNEKLFEIIPEMRIIKENVIGQ